MYRIAPRIEIYVNLPAWRSLRSVLAQTRRYAAASSSVSRVSAVMRTSAPMLPLSVL